MDVTFYPKGLLFGAIVFAVFGVALTMAVDVERGMAGAGMVAIVAYVLIEAIVSVNPAAWRIPKKKD
jgi:hypothetical protein